MFHVIGGYASARRPALAAVALALLVLFGSPVLATAQESGDEASSHASQAASERASEAAAAAAQAAAEKAAATAQAAAEQAASRSAESASAQATAAAEQAAVRSSEAAATQAGDAAARAAADNAGEKAQQAAEQSVARASEDAAGRAQTQAADSSAEGATNHADEAAAERAGSSAGGRVESDAADRQAEDSTSARAASVSAAEDDRSSDAQATAAASTVDDGEATSAGSTGGRASKEAGLLARLTLFDRGPQLDVAHEPDGAEVVRHEFVALVGDGQTLAPRAGYRLVDRVRLASLGATLLRFRADRSAVGGEAPGGEVVEPNHVFRLADGTASVQSQLPGALKAGPRRSPFRGRALVGMVDSPVDTHYPGLSQAIQESRSFIAGGGAMPSGHGTAVADILARQNVRILAANAFGLDANGAGAASTAALITSLDWLVGHGARVINLSLTGPRDAALADAIRRAQAKGCVIVAAAGNNGPAAPAAYPEHSRA